MDLEFCKDYFQIQVFQQSDSSVFLSSKILYLYVCVCVQA